MKSLWDELERVCLGCHETKDVEDFPLTARRHLRSGVCSNCQKRRAEEKAWKHAYGITREEYDLLLKQQDGICALCLKTGPGKLEVDHDHRTLRVRGLLCHGCNVRVGKMKMESALSMPWSDSALRERWIAYLKSSG